MSFLASKSKSNRSILSTVFNCVLPRITAGNENVLFYYVQVDVGQGILLAPSGQPSKDSVLSAFRKACLLIHTILQNTIR